MPYSFFASVEVGSGSIGGMMSKGLCKRQQRSLRGALGEICAMSPVQRVMGVV
mgnify:CR=1 FL=1